MVRVDANGVSFAVRTAGPDAGTANSAEAGTDDAPLALLVHGFPDSPRTWRHLAPALLAAGYRVAAPWTRGLPPTGPAPDGRYRPEDLADDLVALHAALGGDERAVLVGHDWGAVAGQVLLSRPGPSPFRAAVLLAIPPLHTVWRTRPLALPAALVQVTYMGVAQLPGIDRLLRARLPGVVRTIWRAWSPDLDPDPADLAAAVDPLAAPGGLAAQLGYYRALPRAIPGLLTGAPAAMACPTLFLHGRDDQCIHVAVAEAAQGDLAPGATLEVIDDVGHFLHLEAPEAIADRVLAHFA